MILQYSSELWRAIAAPLGNHLWQSTLFAAAAALLTLTLRKNQAHVRYGLWFAASLKFFIPFSLLVSTGSHLAWSHASAPTPGFSYVMLEISQPFTAAAAGSTASATMVALADRFLPVLSLGIWLCGCLTVLIFWGLRWRRLAAVLRSALPVKPGLEFELLGHLECGEASPKVKVLFSNSGLEPGVVGIVRPALLLPAGIAERLTNKQLAAILTHELCHVRRRDNLAAAVHMLVEAIFWFHPVVWWIGGRMMHERERACDQEVIRLGNEAQVYAEGILKVCEFYMESSLVCAAGVSGSDLKQRIEEIMIHRIAGKLGLGKKLLLSLMGVAVVLGPVAVGVISATPSQAQSQAEAANVPVYSSVAIKENTSGVPMPPFKILGEPGQMRGIQLTAERFMATLYPLRGLIHVAYGIGEDQVLGGPSWLDTARYDIVATLDQSQLDQLQKLGQDGREFVAKRMLQTLLADRFKLAFHRELQTPKTFEMHVGIGGLKINETAPAPKPDDNRIIQNRVLIDHGHLQASNTTMGQLAEVLSGPAKLKIVDKTGLNGFYNVTLDWQGDSADESDSLVTALREQLGLQLIELAVPVEMLVVDSAQQPEPTSGEMNAPSNLPKPHYEVVPPANSSKLTQPPLVHVREDVMQGLLQDKVPAQYPEAARNAHIQGAVVLDATIGKAGEVENLQILSGHPLLIPAAIDAVRQWKYKPYALNGQPVEVITQVQVTFDQLP